MERTWLCEKTLNLYKDGGECFLGKRLSTIADQKKVAELVVGNQHKAGER
ncbi:hypothetical protein T11_10054 [Trichinella zimbabwensis]|uniref:Uncharacterized protein n=1 Tax=Trichinella zimbabwensis TaxID=268475 RepID=A0A0V1F372_9BILA|nr:hypothetical protein T11_10054 [Trichinella zimbabwensis]